MKKHIFILLSILLNYNFLFAKDVDITLKSQNTDLNVTENSFYSLRITNSISKIKAITQSTEKGSFINLQINGYLKDYSKVGKPQLPVINKLIDIPQDAVVEVNIISYDEEIINLADFGLYYKLNPVQPSISKSDNSPKFYYENLSYLSDEFTKNKLVDVALLGTMRSINLGRITVSPFQYNPVQNIIKVYNNLVFEIKFKNANIAKTINIQKRFYSPYFESTYNNIINYKKGLSKDTLTQYPVKYVIISDSMFQQALQPFVQWKTRKGFTVVQAYTNNPAVGNSTISIHNYLKNLYDSATITNPAPTFVILVGDVDKIPAFPGTAYGGGHFTDLYYCEFTGDIFPEMYYGRFSASTLAQLQPQIDKTLEYEQYLMPDPSYLDSVVMIAGVDVSGSGGNSPTYANGQINYGTDNYFNLAHGIYSNTYLWPQTDTTSNIETTIKNKLNTGVGFANYTAHGSPYGWSNPSFSVSDIPNMNNAHKYGLWVGNCCQSNSFETTECIGEALLRAANKGAIGYIGATNYSYWDEDFYFAVGATTISATPAYDSHLGFYDRTFHDHGETILEWYASQGQSIFAGNLAVTEGGTNLVSYYWEIYQLMGDPSLMPYYSVPMQLTASYNNPIVTGINNLQVTTLPGAYVAISYNNVLLDAKIADNAGNVYLTFNPFIYPDTADIVITKQNCAPFIGTLNIIPGNSAYIILNSYTINDITGNNNSLADYNENISLNLSLSNSGNQPGNNLIGKLKTNDTSIIIIDSIINIGNIAAYSTSTQNGAFSIQIKNYISDQHNATCQLEIKDMLDSAWYSNLIITLNAPVLTITAVTINDSTGNNNHRLNKGENAKICITAKNTGHSQTPNTIGILSSSNQYITIINDSINQGSITINNSAVYKFDISTNASTPRGSNAGFNFSLFYFPYSNSKSFNLPIEQIVEDWEDSTFSKFSWINSSNKPWTIISGTNVFERNYSAKSGHILNNETSVLSINFDVFSSDTLSFYKKISCEKGNLANGNYYWYDYLEFYIDGVSIGKWDGEINWSKESYLLAIGSHTLKWVYLKDDSKSDFSDCAWIDYITFPPLSTASISTLNYENNDMFIYPNPFYNETNIQYTLSNKSNVSLIIYDDLGRQVDMIVNNIEQTKGNYNYIFKNNKLSPGVYYCKLLIDNKLYYNKLILLD